MTKTMKEARDNLIDQTIEAMKKAEAKGQWKAHAKHLARLGRLMAED